MTRAPTAAAAAVATVAVAGLVLALGCSSSADSGATNSASSRSDADGCARVTLTWPGHRDVPVPCRSAAVRVALGVGDFLDVTRESAPHAGPEIVSSNPGVLRAGPVPTDARGRPEPSKTRFAAVARGTSSVMQGDTLLASVTIV